MAHFNTFVFLDLETTGTAQCVSKKDVQITEISMTAIHQDHFKANKTPPRVQNKLTLCIRPRALISLGAMELSGLFNDLVENQSSFTSSIALLLKSFLSNLEQPICILAHNGSNFDFPLLRSELNRVEVGLPSNIYCMDTLSACQVLLNENDEQNNKPGPRYTIDHVPEKIPAPPSTFINQEINETGDNSSRVDASQLVFQTQEVANYIPSRERDGYGQATQEDVLSILERNLLVRQPVTPSRNEFPVSSHTSPSSSNNKRSAKENSTPSPIKRAYIAASIAQKEKERQFTLKPRRLYFGPKRFWPVGNKAGLNLSAVYERVVGKPLEDKHQAEADVSALIEICLKLDGFIEFIEYNAKKFEEVEMMWT